MGKGVLAVVLAGGHSRRMGTDKALLEWRGRPMWEEVWEVAGRCGCTARRLCRRPEQPPLAVAEGEFLPDTSGAGPMAALCLALAAARREGFGGVLLLAVDMAGLDAAWLREGVVCPATGEPGKGRFIRCDGLLQPFGSYYPAAWLSLAEESLGGGHDSLRRWMQTLPRDWWTELPALAPHDSSFLPRNSPEEWNRGSRG